MQISGSSAIVTGGASGLGEVTARALAAAGARVAIFDMNAERGEALASEIGATFCRVDVTDIAFLECAFSAARAAQGQERILVNCAGIASGEKTASRDKATGSPVAHRLANFIRTLNINLIGTFACGSQSAAGTLTLGRGGWRTRCHHQYGICSSGGRSDWAGCLCGIEGGGQRHDFADRARSNGRWDPLQRHPARHIGDADADRAAAKCARFPRCDRSLSQEVGKT